MDKGAKFSIIKMLKAEKMFEDCIPDFITLTSRDFEHSIGEFLSKSSCIMRSSLKNEACITVLNAGKSLSIKDIRNESDFKNAYVKVSAQDDLEEIILQKQILYVDHVTVLLDEDFLYGNLTTEGKSGFFVLSPLTKVGIIPSEKRLGPFLDRLRQRFKKGKWLFELGISPNSVSLFQAVLVPTELLNSIFTDDLLCKILKTKATRPATPSFWQLLACEWKAFLFRRQDHANSSVSEAFANWYYLFHYFYLYCRINRRHGYDSDFVDFLKLSYGNQTSWQTEIIKKHLRFAAEIRKNETDAAIPASFTTMSGSAYFLGKGRHEGIIGKDALLLDEIIPDVIYQLPPGGIIITPSSQILGHGILAAVERNINILANVEGTFFSSLTGADHFCIDFEKGSFVIKS